MSILKKIVAGIFVLASAVSYAYAETKHETWELPSYGGDVENAAGRTISLGDQTIMRSNLMIVSRQHKSKDVKQHNIILTPPAPRYHHIIFVGGKGDLKCNRGGAVEKKGLKEGINFVLRTRLDYAAAGGNVVMYCAPNDRWKKTSNRNWQLGKGKNNDYRVSEDFVTDFQALAAILKKQRDLPIVVNGTSSGARAAAHLAINAPDVVDLLIISGPDTKSQAKNLLTDFNAETIKQPTLVLINSEDACKYTPPKLSRQFFKLLTAEGKSLVELSGGKAAKGKMGKNCKPLSKHGFHGIESQAVSATVEFIEKSL